MSDRFEEQLATMMRGLADEAPRAPGYLALSAKLARRALMRWLMALAVVLTVSVASIGGAWRAGLLDASREPAEPAHGPVKPAAPTPKAVPQPEQPEPEEKPEVPQIMKPRFAPIAHDADAVEMRESLESFFAAAKVTQAVITKDGANQICFSIKTEQPSALAQAKADLESLLHHYDRAEINFRNGRVSYSLLASGRP